MRWFRAPTKHYAIRTLNALWFSAALSTLILSGPVRAEYRVAPGDVIDFSVAGVPDLKQKSAIDIDGKVTLPLAGSIAAAGLTLSELRLKVGSVLSQKEFRQRGYNKTERDVISSDEVSIAIAEYRPIYVNGDVSRPGSQVFRPGLTARQAVSLAGGYDLLRSRIEDPILQSADLRGSYTTAWINFAKELAHVRRLKAELGQKDDIDDKTFSAIPLPEDMLSTLAQVEDKQLKLGQADFAMQTDHLKRLLAQLVVNRNIMAKRSESESEGLRSDEDEFTRIQDFYKKGLAPGTRISDARRIVLLSSVQSLQSAVELERAKTDLENADREVLKYDSARRLKLLTELRDANAKLQVLQSDIKTVSEKLAYVGMRKSFGRDGGPETNVRIVRNAKEVTTDLEVELLPGDVVEVKLNLEVSREAVR
ncbi:polysaccharide export outer membrane protein [Nitrobacteraceae bacterium AZCC 2146]